MIVTDTLAFLIVFIPAVLNLGILVYLFFLPKRGYTNNFALIIIALLMWQVEDIMSRTLVHEHQIQFWDRMMSMGWIAMAPLIFQFAIKFSTQRLSGNSHWNILIYLPFAIFYMIYVGNPELPDFIHHPFWGWISQPRPGTLDVIQRHVISVVIFVSTGILLRHYFNNRFSSTRKRMQALIISVGLLIPTLQGTITQVIFPAYYGMEVPVTSSFMTFFSLSVILAISRYRMFEVADSLDVSNLIENLNSVVVVLSPKGKIIYFNTFTARLFNYPKLNEPVELRKLVGPFKFQEVENEVLQPTLKGTTVTNYELAVRNPLKRKLWLSISTELIVNNGNVQGILAVAHDITERRKSRETLNQQNKALRKIAYTQSHIVRAPLARILGLIGLLDLTKDIDPENKKIIENVQHSVLELDEVIREIVRNTSPPEN